MTYHITTIPPKSKRRSFEGTRAVVIAEQCQGERDLLLQLLVEREAEIRQLRRMLSEEQRAGQRRIARELHDGVAQHITAASLHLQALVGRYRPRSPEARALLEHAIELVHRAADEVRQVIAGTLPASLDERCLSEAIRKEAMTLQQDGWQVVLQAEDVDPLPQDVAWALFRVAQEALQNIRWHAGRCRVWVTLTRTGERTQLEIADDGCGFDPRRIPSTRFGLAGMKERVALLDGAIEIQSRPGDGTRITVQVRV